MKRALALAFLLPACAVPLDDEAPLSEPDDVLPAMGPAEEGLNLGVDAEHLAIRGLRRELSRGPLVAGHVERFRVDLDGAEVESVEWTSSAGATWTDGEVVQWTLPPLSAASLTARVTTTDGRTIEGTFDLPIEWDEDDAFAVAAGAVGQVDPTPDDLGSCSMDIDGSDTPHVAYWNETHAQLWYGWFDGTTWQLELVDGPGFGVGGQVDDEIDLVVSSSGQPHIVYRYANASTEVRYATKIGANWVRELVAGSAQTIGGYAIALDPVNGERATILYSRDISPYQPRMAYRTGAGAWTIDPLSISTSNNWSLGGLAFAPNGTAYAVHNQYTPQYTTWTAASGWATPSTILTTADSSQAHVAIDGANQPIVMMASVFGHYVGGVLELSPWESFTASYFDLAVDSLGEPRFASKHGGMLEFGELNSENYWLYEEIDSMASENPSIAVDSSDLSHACYTKSTQIWFY